LLTKRKQKSLDEVTSDTRGARLSSVINPWNELKPIVHHDVIQALETTNLDNLTQESLRPVVEENLDLQAETQGLILTRADRQRLVQELIDEILGFGPITSLLHDPSVTEVMVNGPYQVYVERNGKLQKSEVTFSDDRHVLHIIEKIVAPLGRRIDESQPMVDARLPDGSRVNAIIPPLALNGPTITIRKFATDPFKVEDLIDFGTLTEEMTLFLEACVKGRLNIVVSGGTGSGKTTTLGVLSSYIPEDERIITVEDAAELQLRQSHVVTLETRPANIEGKGAITIRDLVKNTLRMRPERIIEVRSGEVLDMLQAMNTGHDGSLTTGHANTPRDMLARLETMVLMAGMDLPLSGGEFVILQFLLTLIFFFIGLLITHKFLFGLCFGILGYLAPQFWLKRAQKVKKNRFNNQLVDALLIIANSLRAGFSFMQAMDLVSKEMSDPISGELQFCLREMNYGTPTEEALLNFSERVGSDDLDLLVTAILIQRQVGGNLAEVLQNIHSTIQDRLRIQREIRTLTAQGKISGYIIAALPFGLAAVLCLINPGYMAGMITEKLGWAMIASGLFMEVIGFLIIRKIITIKL
jgi:pilus assembly protein CpaF